MASKLASTLDKMKPMAIVAVPLGLIAGLLYLWRSGRLCNCEMCLKKAGAQLVMTGSNGQQLIPQLATEQSGLPIPVVLILSIAIIFVVAGGLNMLIQKMNLAKYGRAQQFLY